MTRPLTAAERLDAADGVIDGAYYGSKIVGGGYPASRPLTAAERLDAADGVIDGRYYGSRIVPSSSYYGGVPSRAVVPYSRSYGAGAYDDWYYPSSYDYGYSAAYPRGYRRGYSAYPSGAYPSTAYPSSAYPSSYYGAYAPPTSTYAGAYRGIGYDYDGYYAPRSYYGNRGSYYGGYRPSYGGYYGTYGAGYSRAIGAPLTAAERLDAADGVIDGAYYGSKIVGGGY
eukprot:TRINITY_DN344_c0_g1_i1.p2 TRINITY_DN344_c0_g1~~TRINITY_DN344_c0_g1_i1.p2  ORF type:complete len:227 (-),score=23.64 TRINITY_DN344_c0_g1_i1:3066-3746(-)